AESGASKERIMLSICLDSGSVLTLEEMMTILLAEAARGDSHLFEKIKEIGLESYYWAQTKRVWGYKSEQPSVKDFAVSIFKTCYALELNQPAPMKAHSLSFIQRWKDSIRFGSSFEHFSHMSAGILGIKDDLHHHDLSALIEMDLYEEIDRHII